MFFCPTSAAEEPDLVPQKFRGTAPPPESCRFEPRPAGNHIGENNDPASYGQHGAERGADRRRFCPVVFVRHGLIDDGLIVRDGKFRSG
jgi:hypothetical protein